MPVAVGLGGNVGDVAGRFAWAFDRLTEHLDSARLGPLVRSAPLEAPDQPAFLNTVLVGATRVPARELLVRFLELERVAGRPPGRRHGPRPLDLDLLVYGDLEMDEPGLTVPHPRLRQRRFVLEPLAEIAPDLPLPPDGRTAHELLPAVADQQVERLAWDRLPSSVGGRR